MLHLAQSKIQGISSQQGTALEEVEHKESRRELSKFNIYSFFFCFISRIISRLAFGEKELKIHSSHFELCDIHIGGRSHFVSLLY